MKKLLFTLIILNIASLYSIEYKEYDAFARTYVPYDSTGINPNRMAFSIASTLVASAGSYYAVKTAWWYDQAKDFHFDEGLDLIYSSNLDKFAHFYGGTVIQDIYYRSLRWSNMDEVPALWTSMGFSMFIQVMIEMKDGYAHQWGFSLYDMMYGTLGSSYHLLQYKYPFLDDFNFKMSYYTVEDDYDPWRANKFDEVIEDYPNQTYWLTWKTNNSLPNKVEKYWPDFLGLALGFSVDDRISMDPTDKYDKWEIYLAFDYDIEEMVKNVDSPIIKSIAHYLNYIKFPSPAIRFTPKFKAYGIYF
ncbi:MAG: DUF2279 domain-containing protein [Candidatus Delongbacteria bacterium]|jgi:hypothetical protein|nr:DUF2279 domain-containing protein [Candidatus Delongbacteria bacterium]